MSKAKKSVPAVLSDTPLETRAQRGELMFTHYDGKKIQATIENMRDLLLYYKVICRYNVISKRIHHVIPEEEFTPDNEEEAALACIFSYMKQWCMGTEGYKGYLLRIADENQYNPVLEWVTSTPWDGKNRLQEFFDTITAKNEHAKNLFIRRWMITAMYLAMHDGVDSPGCLVLQGAQGLGKTWWFRKLCPIPGLIKTDANIDPRSRDSVSQVIRHWIVELGEIGSTFKRADIDALKAFITAPSDTLRRPYGTTDQDYPRRTALAASVNEMIYLHDTTGNRRYFTVQCTKVNSYHDINMQQVWAEIYNLIVNCEETQQLTDEEKKLVDEVNQEHMQIDPIMEMILEKYKWDEFMMVADWKTATEIAQDIGLKNITVKETRAIAGHILKLNENQRKQSGPRKLLKVPACRSY